jgi:ATP-dependent Clp protease ATP-binding subunit ClpA
LPDFINRIDSLVIFQTLGSEALLQVLDQQIGELQAQMQPGDGRDLRPGCSRAGAQVPARTENQQQVRRPGTKADLQRHIQTLASMVTAGEVQPGTRVRVEVGPRKERLVLRAVDEEALVPVN